jgi:hypothetical protein
MTRGNLQILRNHLAKVRVAGSSPVARSERKRRSEALSEGPRLVCGRVAR